jgi:hypothetical protein
MKLMKVFAVLVALSTGLSGAMHSSAAEGDEQASSTFGETMPTGYRDWTLISVAHEEGKLNDIRAILGNEIAVKAYREGTLPFPDGAIIARLAWQYVPSDENNKAFGHPQSFVAGPPTNVQFLRKDSKQYASTGGWEFVQFNDGKPAHMDAKVCFSCHVPVKDRDFVFTRYSP